MDIPFATTADVEARWRDMSPGEAERCGQLLKDASVYIAQAMLKAGRQYADVEPDSLTGLAMTMVCADMVIRAMKTPVDQQAATNYTQSAVGYSETFTYANPSGDLYMTKSERKALGVGGFAYGAILPDIHRGCPGC